MAGSYSGVEDGPENETRFVWLARERPVVPHVKAKTSVCFWGLPDAPGALVEVLTELAERGINLTKIESRPLKLGLGRYIFFADLEGDERDSAVVSALEAIRGRVETLRVLGSYPTAVRPPAG